MNRKGEVDFLVHCFKRFAGGRSDACSTSRAAPARTWSGWPSAATRMSGLDLSARNIEFLGERLAAKGLDGDLVVGGHDRLPAASARSTRPSACRTRRATC